MCGIAGHIVLGSEYPEPKMLMDLFTAQENRGKDASGLCYRRGDEVVVIKEPILATDLAKKINWEEVARSPWSLLHARAKTQGTEKKNENNHPVESTNWKVVHNGIVSNDDDLIAHYGVERPAEVDSIAIPYVLEQGQTTRESLDHLSVLGGMASFAAVHTGRLEEIVLARLNGAQVFIQYNPYARVFYWSSDNGGIFQNGHPTITKLAFSNVGILPDRHVLVLNTNGRVARFEVPGGHSFFRPKVARPKASSTSTRVVGPEGGRVRGFLPKAVPDSANVVTDAVEQRRLLQWLGGKGGSLFRGAKTIPTVAREDYERLGKPFPDFTNDRVLLVNDTPPMGTAGKFNTPYGTWHVTKDDMDFKPAKRMRGFWRGIHEAIGVDVDLPANANLQEELEGTMRVECVEIKYQGVDVYVRMCPWCGVITTSNVWQNAWKRVCQWCRVRSYQV